MIVIAIKYCIFSVDADAERRLAAVECALAAILTQLYSVPASAQSDTHNLAK